jgi:hypothetical protein
MKRQNKQLVDREIIKSLKSIGFWQGFTVGSSIMAVFIIFLITFIRITSLLILGH